MAYYCIPYLSTLILVSIGYTGAAQQKHNTNHRYNSKFSESHIKKLTTVELILIFQYTPKITFQPVSSIEIEVFYILSFLPY